ncbi:MAG: hypothetical protein WD872_07855 [Pirellulaceae bacterium]
MPAPKSILTAAWDVPQELRDRLGEQVGRQRAMFAEGHLLLVLHRPPKQDDAQRVGRLFWRKPDGVWQSNDLGSGAAAVARHLSEFGDAIERCDRQEDAATSVDEYFQVLGAMAPLQRAARNLHSALQEARKLLADDRDLINFRDRAYEIERSAELLYGDVRNALDFAVAKQSEQQATAAHQMARSAHRLNILVALFFPIATLTAIFGSGLRHPLEDVVPPPYAFYSVIAVGLVTGCIIALYLAAASQGKAKPRSLPRQ